VQRVLEPEVMDSWEEAVEYDAMDFTEVNTVNGDVRLGPIPARVLDDAGTGSARIPVLLCKCVLTGRIVRHRLSKKYVTNCSQHVEQAGLQQQIVFELVDAKQLPYEDEYF